MNLHAMLDVAVNGDKRFSLDDKTIVYNQRYVGDGYYSSDINISMRLNDELYQKRMYRSVPHLWQR